MTTLSVLQAQDIASFLHSQRNKPTLRFITCGSVDDGKSTLIGRLLFESKAIFDDQLASLEKDSRQYGTQGEKIDLALLLDGLQAEREQGITIDVAYRFFATDKRRFIVADTPGHEQYTRNMATGASTADVAVILIDARKGVLTQTRRHSRIVAMMGIRHVVLAVNKMDLVGFGQDTFNTIVADYQVFAQDLGFQTVQAIPLSGLGGRECVAPERADAVVFGAEFDGVFGHGGCVAHRCASGVSHAGAVGEPAQSGFQGLLWHFGRGAHSGR